MFETLEWVIEKGWPVFSKRKINAKQTLKVGESSNSITIS
jgi:hypothetical protein